VTTNAPYTVSVREACERTGLKPWRIYDLTRSGQVEARYVNSRNFLIVWSSLVAWLESSPREPAP